MESAPHPPAACPDEAIWHAYATDVLPPAIRAHLRRHLANCRDCFRALAAHMTLAMRMENPRCARVRPVARKHARVVPGDPEFALLAILYRQRSR